MPRVTSNRSAILEQAVQLGSIRGLEGLSIGAVAEAVGMSKGGICAHFRSKKDLQLATVERAAQIFQEHVILPTRSKPSGKLRLEALDAAWFKYLERGVFQGGCFFSNAVTELDDLELESVRELVVVQYNRFLEYVQYNVLEAVRKNEFKSTINPELFVLEWMGIKLSALLWRGLGRHYDLARVAAQKLIEEVSVD
jgi:AcrR family transcriptional regulator